MKRKATPTTTPLTNAGPACPLLDDFADSVVQHANKTVNPELLERITVGEIGDPELRQRLTLDGSCFSERREVNPGCDALLAKFLERADG